MKAIGAIVIATFVFWKVSNHHRVGYRLAGGTA
jgi:hypothetical protein